MYEIFIVRASDMLTFRSEKDPLRDQSKRAAFFVHFCVFRAILRVFYVFRATLRFRAFLRFSCLPKRDPKLSIILGQYK